MLKLDVTKEIFQVNHRLILLTAVLVLACEQDELPMPERTIPESVRPHIDRFLWEAEKRGLTLDISELSVEFDTDIGISVVNNQQTIVGSCNRSANLNLVKIDTLNSLWLLSGQMGQEEIIFHELGHCLLGRQHKDEKLLSGDFASIMRTVGFLQYGDLNQYTSLFLNPTGIKAHRRDYYLNELFEQNTPAPCWSDSKIGSSYEVVFYDHDIIKERGRNMWIDSKNDLWLYGGDNCLVFSEGISNTVLTGTRITDLQNDNQGNLWVAGTNGDESFISTYRNGELDKEPGSVSLPSGLSGIDKIFIDELDRLWVTDQEGEIFVRNADMDFEMIQVLPDGRVSKILRGPDKKIYMLKGQMFLIFGIDLNPAIMNEENSELPTDLFGDMVVDGQGVAWLRYTRPAPKLIKFWPDGQVEVLDFYDINLAEISLRSMTTDHLNNLWIATSKGIKKWEGNTFSNYCTYNAGLGILDFSSIAAGNNGIIWSIGIDTVSLERRLLRMHIEK